jgi:hypothetical protein
MIKDIAVNESTDLESAGEKKSNKAGRKYRNLERKLRKQMAREAKRLERESYDWASLDIE